MCWHNDDGKPEIVAGHARAKAAQELGIEKVPVVFRDDWTDAQRRAYTLADNQTTMMTGWDDDQLAYELDSLADEFDMGDFGFDLDSALEDLPTGASDEVPEDAPERVKPGEVWLLGQHRLMCGDSTDAASVAKLFDGDRADVCFTSPPYNMAAGGTYDDVPNKAMHGGRAYRQYTDDLDDGGYTDLLVKSLGNALDHCDDAMFNIGILAGSKVGVANMMHAFAPKIVDIVVWNKDISMPMGLPSNRGMLSHRCEPIFCFSNSGERSFTHPQWDRGNGINRIDTSNASGNKFASNHAATFPVELAERVVGQFSKSSVCDLFGGTGTTLVACESLGRRCYMMEMDPRYCDLIIKRWEDMTGREAERVG